MSEEHDLNTAGGHHGKPDCDSPVGDLNTEFARVSASRAFSKTARLLSFLRYICTAAAEGRLEDLTEQRIGQQVFGRSGHYNATEDTIVRSTARLLRLRLEMYYADEGRDDRCRLAVPRGAYVPVVFPADRIEGNDDALQEAAAELRDPALAPAPEDAPLAAPPSIQTTQEAPPRPRPLFRLIVPPRMRRLGRAVRVQVRHHWTLCGVLGFGLAVATGMGASAFTRPSAPLAGVDAMWDELFASDRNTLLVVADSNLVMYQLEVLREVPLEDYISKRIAPDPARADVKFLRNRQTSISAVGFAVELGKLAGTRGVNLQTRYARDLRLNELKDSNAIMLGVRQSNPWVELFRDRFNFHIDWDIATEKFLVRNDRPLAGERGLYEYSKDDPKRRGYVHVAFTRALGAAGHMLLVAGTTASGAEAAQEFVLDARRMQPLLQRARRSDGSIGDFEVLLQCVLQAGGSTDVQILSMRADGG